MAVALQVALAWGGPDFSYLGDGGDQLRLVTSLAKARRFRTEGAAMKFWRRSGEGRFRSDTTVMVVPTDGAPPGLHMNMRCRRCGLTERFAVPADAIPRCRNCGRAGLVAALPVINPAKIAPVHLFDLEMA